MTPNAQALVTLVHHRCSRRSSNGCHNPIAPAGTLLRSFHPKQVREAAKTLCRRVVCNLKRRLHGYGVVFLRLMHYRLPVTNQRDRRTDVPPTVMTCCDLTKRSALRHRSL